MPTGCVYEMFSDNAKCNKTYIGSTTGSLRARLASHKYARHPIFTFGDADVRVLEKDIPAGELHQRKSAYMREKRDGLFNSRAAGCSQKHACHENVDVTKTGKSSLPDGSAFVYFLRSAAQFVAAMLT